jgi:hypothetical protein
MALPLCVHILGWACEGLSLQKWHITDDAAHDKTCFNSGLISLAPSFFLARRL